MNRSGLAATTAGRAALGLLTVSVVLFVWAVVSAFHAPSVSAGPAPQFASAGALTPPTRANAADLNAAIDADLFAPDRSPPENRYRAPGEELPDDSPKPPEILPVVLGTAVSDSVHSFATVQLGEGRTMIVHVGDKIGEYTVKAIDREHVTFTNSAKKSLDIPELKP